MLVFKTRAAIINHLKDLKKQSKSIGFVPTMGALHEGHRTLLKQSFSENNITVCSIFVNPLQFNNPDDLVKYPRTIEADMNFIESCCDILFYPEYSEIYPDSPQEKFEFGNLDKILEAEFRPGHFYGVAVVVHRLFNIVQPNKAYFGIKDYQQLQIIKSMVRQKEHEIDIVPCAIVREADGLAMSSRNQRLCDTARQIAPMIYQTLKQAVAILKEKNVVDAKQFVMESFASKSEFKLEYFEWIEPNSFEIVDNTKPEMVGLIAVWLDNIRLIDNIIVTQ
jgi:pantoate--beta-alanine ligase